MATNRTAAPENDPDAPAPDAVTTPSAVGATQTDFQGFIWQQLNNIHKTLGSILANQSTSEDRLKGLEGKVSVLNRIVWIGVGIFGTVAAVAAIAQPLVHLLIRIGIVTP
jgi:hypothetical protein